LKLKRNQKKRFFMERLPEQDVSLAAVLTQIDGHQPTPGQQQTTMALITLTSLRTSGSSWGLS
jgi:hypothetical protein